MTVLIAIHCNADFCTETFDVPHARTLMDARVLAKRAGWVETRRNRQVADYCAAHAGWRTT